MTSCAVPVIALPCDDENSGYHSKLVDYLERNQEVPVGDVELAEALQGPYLSRSNLERLAAVVVLGPNAAAQFARQWGSSGPDWNMSVQWAYENVASNPRAALAAVVSYQWWFGQQATLPIGDLADAFDLFGTPGVARVAISFVEAALATSDHRSINEDVLECFHLALTLCGE